MPIRIDFPPPGNPSYLDGTCDGWEYRIVFAGTTLQKTYDMVVHFLNEEGYDDVPLPANAKELLLFKKNRHRQATLFEDSGYVHNPVKILFPRMAPRRNSLLVCLYNEQHPQHLLKFHKVLPE